MMSNSINSGSNIDGSKLSLSSRSNNGKAAGTQPGGLECHLELEICAKYLNTDHDIMEIFVEPWSVYGDLSYATAGVTESQDDGNRDDGVGGGDSSNSNSIDQNGNSNGNGDGNNSSNNNNNNNNSNSSSNNNNNTTDLQEKLCIKIICPNFLNVDFAPPTIKTLTLLNYILSADSHTYEKMAHARTLDDLRDFWLSVDTQNTDSLDALQVEPIVRSLYSTKLKGGEQMTELEVSMQWNLI